MSAERLFKVIGQVDDGLLEETERYRTPYKERHWARWGALAACAALVIGGAWLGRLVFGGASSSAPGLSGGAPGEGSGSVFEAYAGPVLPLTAEGDLDGLTAEREVTFTVDEGAMNVRDSYTLVNSTAEDKVLELYYPYIDNFGANHERTPTLEQNGEPLETGLLIGAYTGGFDGLNQRPPASWKTYGELLADGAYFEDAKAAVPWPDCPVTVYTFHDVSVPEERRHNGATLAIAFTLPEGSYAMTWNMNGGSVDEKSGWRQYSYFAGHPDEERMVIVLGEPPEEYKVVGYTDGGCDEETPDVTGRVETYSSTLYQVVEDCVSGLQDASYTMANLSEEARLQAVLSALRYTEMGDSPTRRHQWMSLQSIISDAITMERVLYRTAKITVPANGTVELTAAYSKNGSQNFEHCRPEEQNIIEGYELATTLGSTLTFTAQRAAVELPDSWTVMGESFGFDVENGITEVALDLSVERYYLEVRKIGE